MLYEREDFLLSYFSRIVLMTKLLSALRDPIWQFFGAALALITIIVSLQQTYNDGTLEKLVIAPHSKYGLVSFIASSQDPKSSLQVLVNGKLFPSKQLIVNTYYIWNKGRKPITPDEYYEKITVIPEDGFEILEVKEVTDAKTSTEYWEKGLKGEFILKDPLINPNESIFFQVFLRVKDEKLIKDYGNLDDTKFIEFSGKVKKC